MTAYIEIPDADIEPDQPIKSSTAFALRDNLKAVVEGDPTAPSVQPAILLIGGKGGDGALSDATALSGLGYFEFSSMLVTAAKTIPACTIIRIAGDAVLSDILTVSTLASNVTTRAAQRRAAELGLNAISGSSGASATDGGGSAGASDTQPGIDFSLLRYSWVTRRPLLGGDGATPATADSMGGGAVIIIIEGDLDCTGGTIRANGDPGASGGGGAGSIIIICTRTITGGTYEAKGGDGASNGDGGGGGLVQLVATAFAGTRTRTVTGGAGAGTGVNGTAGYQGETTLTRDQIRTMLQRL